MDTGIRVPRPILTMLLLWCSLSAIAVVVLGARVCGTISVGDPFVLFLCAYGFVGLFVTQLKILEMWENQQDGEKGNIPKR